MLKYETISGRYNLNYLPNLRILLTDIRYITASHDAFCYTRFCGHC